jgi:hypothetical protein
MLRSCVKKNKVFTQKEFFKLKGAPNFHGDASTWNGHNVYFRKIGKHSMCSRTIEVLEEDTTYPGKRKSIFYYTIGSNRVVVAGKLYSCLSLDKSASAYGTTIQSKKFWDKNLFLQWLWSVGYELVNPDKLGNLEGKPTELDTKAILWLIENNVTVMTFYPFSGRPDAPYCRINGDDLKDLEFYKTLDAFSVFQEIEMWVGGVLAAAGNPMVQITDDKIKVAKHGFDKFSFRKGKETK